MTYKIVADSSADTVRLDKVAFSSVPLHILVGEQEFVDDETVNISAMQKALSAYKGKTSTSCPGPGAWKAAFGDAETVFCVTITSALSGANASANIAKDLYEKDHPDRKVFVFDTLSTGPEMTLLIEKIQELILSGMERDAIYQEACAYLQRTHLLFSLASVENFAKNGRINPLVAKGVGLLGIRIVGTASDTGTLHPLNKCRGDQKAISCLLGHMKEAGYQNGTVIIAHNDNEAGAQQLKEQIAREFGAFHGKIHRTRALCSYYAEPKSILIGFEA
jgi:DegV family protein with EDD domain